MMITGLILGIFTFVQLNCENLFDCVHDSLKHDLEYTPGHQKQWDRQKYWNKVRHISAEILACGMDDEHGAPLLPALVALCEVENDSVMGDLTRHTALRKFGYRYLITQSADLRGIDVALLYSPASFQLINTHPLRVAPTAGRRPTRDILYAAGKVASGDTLHVFVVHAPSRLSGKQVSADYRMAVMQRLMQSVDSIRSLHPDPRIVVSGDFNDTTSDASIRYLLSEGMSDVSADAKGSHGAKGSYKYQGVWETIDHILISSSLQAAFVDCCIFDAPYLLEDDMNYGGKKPFRTYNGYQHTGGFSDHLPLVARFRFHSEFE